MLLRPDWKSRSVTFALGAVFGASVGFIIGAEWMESFLLAN